MLQDPQLVDPTQPLPPQNTRRPSERGVAQAVVTSLLVVLAFGAGWFGNAYVNQANYIPADDVDQHIINQAYSEITKNYVFTNAIDTRTDGVDVTANYTIRLSASEMYLRAAYNNTRTNIVGSIATPPQLAAYSSVLFDRIEQRRVECAQPGDSLRLGGGWRARQLAIDVNQSRYGSYCSLTLSPADDQQFGAKWLTDVELSYRVAGYRLAIGAQNLFDVLPDRNTAINSFSGIQTFPSHSRTLRS